MHEQPQGRSTGSPLYFLVHDIPLKQIIFCCLILLVMVLPAGRFITAQDGGPITYGDTVRGEITGAVPEIHYTFEGAAGDVIAVEMLSVDRSLHNTLSEPVLKLLNPDDFVVMDTTLAFPVDDTLLIAELEADGIYTIVVTRDENVPEPAFGSFTLRLLRIAEIEFDSLIEDRISNEDFGRYYAVRVGSAWSLEYARVDGEYSPAISVNRISLERGGLDPVARVSGQGVTRITLGVFEPDETYIIILTPSPLDFQFGDVFAEYRLRLTPS